MPEFGLCRCQPSACKRSHMFNVHPPVPPACRVYRMPSLPCAAATAQRADLRCAGSLCALRRRGSRTHSAGVHAALGACLPPSRYAVPTPPPSSACAGSCFSGLPRFACTPTPALVQPSDVSLTFAHMPTPPPPPCLPAAAWTSAPRFTPSTPAVTWQPPRPPSRPGLQACAAGRCEHASSCLHTHELHARG